MASPSEKDADGTEILCGEALALTPTSAEEFIDDVLTLDLRKQLGVLSPARAHDGQGQTKGCSLVLLPARA